jgi:hypothetical protein
MLSVEQYAPSAQITPSVPIILSERTESTATDSKYTTIHHRCSTELEEEEELQEAEQLEAVDEDVLHRRHEQLIHVVRGSEELDRNSTRCSRRCHRRQEDIGKYSRRIICTMHLN